MENVSKKAIEALNIACEYFDALGSLSNEIYCADDPNAPDLSSLERYIDDAMIRIARDYGEIRSVLQNIAPNSFVPQLPW